MFVSILILLICTLKIQLYKGNYSLHEYIDYGYISFLLPQNVISLDKVSQYNGNHISYILPYSASTILDM